MAADAGELTGKVAIVTGSSSGIGEAIARSLGDAGARVVINSSRSRDAGEAVAASLPDAIYAQGSIADDDEAASIIAAAVDRFGSLDILVNNAGITREIPHTDIDAATVDVWREIFEVNVFGTWRMCQLALPHLRASGDASIINISSIAGIRQVGSSLPYAASKAALNHQTRLLARVAGPEVRVNAVAPGLVDTPWTAEWEQIRRDVSARAPLRRSGAPDDVADAVLGLIRSRYATGQVIAIDGGLGLL